MTLPICINCSKGVEGGDKTLSELLDIINSSFDINKMNSQGCAINVSGLDGLCLICKKCEQKRTPRTQIVKMEKINEKDKKDQQPSS